MNNLPFHLVDKRIFYAHLDDISDGALFEIHNAVHFGSLTHRATEKLTVLFATKHQNIHGLADACGNMRFPDSVAYIPDTLSTFDFDLFVNLAGESAARVPSSREYGNTPT